ncbi:MAG: GAF domain-containing protein [Clostridiales bacterium]|nr:GAF domain-containing protein [Clostridiales bacterium]
MPDYALLNETLAALIGNVPHPLSNLANAAALLWESLCDLNWAGFYLLARDGLLVLGPFQGKTACIEIPVGRGVCGTAVLKNETQLVPDVHLFPGHIACDSASESEIVIPIRKGGVPVGVLDIDSPVKNRFGEEDREGLEAFVRVLENALPDDFPARLL